MWVRREVEKYVPKELPYDEELSEGPPYEMKTRLFPFLKKQIEFVYNMLPENEQKKIATSVDVARRVYGPNYARSTDNFEHLFYVRAMLPIQSFFKQGNVLNPHNFQWVAYNDNGKQLRVVKSLAIQGDQNVYLVLSKSGERWVMKWEAGIERTPPEENEEMIEYAKLESMGAQCPRRKKGYKMMGFGVLIIEFLDPLDSNDNVIELGRQLLMGQLRYIHRYACYGDLKLDNIRKRPSTPTSGPRYFIIDMNLSKHPHSLNIDNSREATKIGYRREHFTPLFTSQLMIHYYFPVSMTYKNDLIELLYVMNQLLCQRAYDQKISIFDPKNIDQLKKNLGLLPGDFVADPLRMEKDPVSETRRGWVAMQTLLVYGINKTPFILGHYRDNIDILPFIPKRKTYHILVDALEKGLADYEFFVTASQKRIVECKICASITNTKCGYCYHSITPLCSNTECIKKHRCL